MTEQGLQRCVPVSVMRHRSTHFGEEIAAKRVKVDALRAADFAGEAHAGVVEGLEHARVKVPAVGRGYKNKRGSGDGR